MKERRPITAEESLVCMALQQVRYLPCSWDKRFAHSMSTPSPLGVTDAEMAQAWRLFIRYRRQINCPRKEELLKMATDLAAVDFRKQSKMMREQAEIDRLKAEYNRQMQLTK